MNSCAKFTLVFLCTLLAFSTAIAQESGRSALRDFETWSALELRYKHNKRWRFGLQEQLRMNNNSSRFDRLFTQLEAQLRLAPEFEISAGLRYLSIDDVSGATQGLEHHFRWHIDVRHKIPLKQLTISNRIRLQRRNELGVNRTEGDYPIRATRWKTTVKYRIKDSRLTPLIASELFYHRETGAWSGLTPFRVSTGFHYKLGKPAKLAVLYIWERELVPWEPQRTNVIKVKYTHRLKR